MEILLIVAVILIILTVIDMNKPNL